MSETRCSAQSMEGEGHGMKMMKDANAEIRGINGLETMNALCNMPYEDLQNQTGDAMSDEEEALLRVYRRHYVGYAREKKLVQGVVEVQSLC